MHPEDSQTQPEIVAQHAHSDDQVHEVVVDAQPCKLQDQSQLLVPRSHGKGGQQVGSQIQDFPNLQTASSNILGQKSNGSHGNVLGWRQQLPNSTTERNKHLTHASTSSTTHKTMQVPHLSLSLSLSVSLSPPPPPPSTLISIPPPLLPLSAIHKCFHSSKRRLR